MTRSRTLLAAGLGAMVGLYGLAAHAETIREAVDAGNRALVAAILRGDARAASELYTVDAQVIAPGAPVARGRAAIASAWQATIDAGVKNVKLETTDVETSGDLACETGVVRVDYANGGVTVARYVVVWKREAGRWKLHRDIWNTAS